MPRKKKKTKRPEPLIAAALARLTPAQLRAMYKIAKVPNKGLTPFFTAPYNMMALRDAAHKETP